MSTALVHVPSHPNLSSPSEPLEGLRAAVLNSVVSVGSKRNYAKALDELQTFCLDREAVLSRSLLLEFRAAMLERNLSPSMINVKLSAVRSLIGEARPAFWA